MKTLEPCPPAPQPYCEDYYPLWKHMSDNHGLTLLDSECEDILQVADKSKSRPLATITAERDAAITQAKHLSEWATKMHDEMLHQSARANEWREEATKLAAALTKWADRVANTSGSATELKCAVCGNREIQDGECLVCGSEEYCEMRGDGHTTREQI